MVCLSVDYLVQPVDLPAVLVRQAHELLDAGNEYGAAICCREAMRRHLVKLTDDYHVRLRRSRPITNAYLICRLTNCGILTAGTARRLRCALLTLNKLCHCEPVPAFALADAVAAVDELFSTI